MRAPVKSSSRSLAMSPNEPVVIIDDGSGIRACMIASSNHASPQSSTPPIWINGGNARTRHGSLFDQGECREGVCRVLPSGARILDSDRNRSFKARRKDRSINVSFFLKFVMGSMLCVARATSCVHALNLPLSIAEIAKYTAARSPRSLPRCTSTAYLRSLLFPALGKSDEDSDILQSLAFAVQRGGFRRASFLTGY